MFFLLRQGKLIMKADVTIMLSIGQTMLRETKEGKNNL